MTLNWPRRNSWAAALAPSWPHKFALLTEGSLSPATGPTTNVAPFLITVCLFEAGFVIKLAFMAHSSSQHAVTNREPRKLLRSRRFTVDEWFHPAR